MARTRCDRAHAGARCRSAATTEVHLRPFLGARQVRLMCTGCAELTADIASMLAAEAELRPLERSRPSRRTR